MKIPGIFSSRRCGLNIGGNGNDWFGQGWRGGRSDGGIAVEGDHPQTCACAFFPTHNVATVIDNGAT